MPVDLKADLSRGKSVVAGWLMSASPLVAEALASCGFDAVVFDMEHGPLDEVAAQSVFAITEKYECAPLVRLPSADPFLARRLLDGGAQGLIIPGVEDLSEFQEFVEHCLYPPNGRRGTGLGRANLWGDRFKQYYNSFRPLLLPMIESRMGVEISESLVGLEIVDGLFIGPYDLSADLGSPGSFDTPEFNAAIKDIRQACLTANKAPGIHQVSPDVDELRARQEEGYRFLAFGSDLIAMRHVFHNIGNL